MIDALYGVDEADAVDAFLNSNALLMNRNPCLADKLAPLRFILDFDERTTSLSSPSVDVTAGRTFTAEGLVAAPSPRGTG